jgi:type IV pilus assembly protein PilM
MARRLIGLDVGTNAVTIAEVTPGSPPRLDMFAQVALAREAMREGEVADEAAVADAVERLRTEVGLKKVPVRVGIASPRVVVRQVEMPVMTRDELASALKFQAADLIPISIDDAVLDFSILGEVNSSSDGESDGRVMQVLLAAAQEATIMRLVSAVEAGGLQVAAVDLIPIALTRALARPVAAPAAVSVGEGGVALAEEIGAEGIVSFGGGVTAIAVHENGTPRFVRVLGSGGRELTDAIVQDLDVPAETAEALKRALANPAPDEMVNRARTAVDRPLSVLLDEVRSSIDYYRNQQGAARLTRVVVTGGSAQLPGLPERLGALMGVPVEPAYMHDLIRVGNIGFAPEELPRLEPYLPAAVGLALGGTGEGTVIDLMPRRGRSRRVGVGDVRSRINRKAVMAIGAAVLVLGGATYMAHAQASSAQSKKAAAETEATKLKNQIGHILQAQSPSGATANLQVQAATALGTDVGWTDMINNLGHAMPPGGVWLTTFQAAKAAPARAAAAPAPAAAGSSGSSGSSPSASPSASATGQSATGTTATATPSPTGAASCSAYEGPLSGTVTMNGVATDVNSLAAFMDNAAKAGGNNPDLLAIWLVSAQKAKFGTADVITFQMSAALAPGARSDRLNTFFKGALCSK